MGALLQDRLADWTVGRNIILTLTLTKESQLTHGNRQSQSRKEPSQSSKKPAAYNYQLGIEEDSEVCVTFGCVIFL
jgi:hypothetical protein